MKKKCRLTKASILRALEHYHACSTDIAWFRRQRDTLLRTIWWRLSHREDTDTQRRRCWLLSAIMLHPDDPARVKQRADAKFGFRIECTARIPTWEKVRESMLKYGWGGR